MCVNNRISMSISPSKWTWNSQIFLIEGTEKTLKEKGALLWFLAAAESVSGMGVRTPSRILLSLVPRTCNLSANLQYRQTQPGDGFSAALLIWKLVPQRLPAGSDIPVPSVSPTQLTCTPWTLLTKPCYARPTSPSVAWLYSKGLPSSHAKHRRKTSVTMVYAKNYWIWQQSHPSNNFKKFLKKNDQCSSV